VGMQQCAPAGGRLGCASGGGGGANPPKVEAGGG